jgi:hypothetical protein
MDSHCMRIMRSRAPSPGRKASQRDWSAGRATPEPEVVSVRRLLPGTANPSNRIEAAWHSNGRRPSATCRRAKRLRCRRVRPSPARRPSDLRLCVLSHDYQAGGGVCDGSTVVFVKKRCCSTKRVGKGPRWSPSRRPIRCHPWPSKPRLDGPNLEQATAKEVTRDETTRAAAVNRQGVGL